RRPRVRGRRRLGGREAGPGRGRGRGQPGGRQVHPGGIMIYLLLGYVYLCIHRPFEIWPAIGDLRVELVYFTLLTLCWIATGPKPRGYGLLLAVLGMFAAFVASWAMSPWADGAEEVVKNYTLVVVFSLMLATAVR